MQACKISCGHPACATVCQSLQETNRPPERKLAVGDTFYRPGNLNICYEVVSAPYLRIFWDWRGRIPQQRTIWYLVAIAFAIAKIDLKFFFGLPFKPTPHKDNNWMLSNGSVLLLFPYTYRVKTFYWYAGQWHQIGRYSELTPRWLS